MPDELENRVTSLETRIEHVEQRLRRSEQDAAAARVLAGAVDRDVAETRTEIRDFRDQNNRLHNATRRDIVDLRHYVETGFADVNARFADVNARFADVNARFDTVAVGQEQIVGMLNTLIERDAGA